MRSRTAVLIALLVVATVAFAHKDESLDELISQADAAPLKSQPKLYTKIAELQLDGADHLYRKGQVPEARTAVKDVDTYSGKAADAAISSGKDLKRTEIAIRKMADKLRDIKQNVNFEERPPIQEAIERMESMRTRLLSRMFGKGKNK
jgi:hypothetical protein